MQDIASSISIVTKFYHKIAAMKEMYQARVLIYLPHGDPRPSWKTVHGRYRAQYVQFTYNHHDHICMHCGYLGHRVSNCPMLANLNMEDSYNSTNNPGNQPALDRVATHRKFPLYTKTGSSVLSSLLIPLLILPTSMALNLIPTMPISYPLTTSPLCTCQIKPRYMIGSINTLLRYGMVMSLVIHCYK